MMCIVCATVNAAWLLIDAYICLYVCMQHLFKFNQKTHTNTHFTSISYRGVDCFFFSFYFNHSTNLNGDVLPAININTHKYTSEMVTVAVAMVMVMDGINRATDNK